MVGPKFDEAEILNTIKDFEENLFKPYHVNFDTMIVDYGWSGQESVSGTGPQAASQWPDEFPPGGGTNQFQAGDVDLTVEHVSGRAGS